MATENSGNPGEILHSIDLIDCRSGDAVNGAEILRGKVAAVAIAPHWLPMPLRQTLASISEHLDELKEQGKPVEFVYVAVDRDEKFISDMKAHGNSSLLDESPDIDCFNTLIKQFGPGWLAVPFENSDARSQFKALRDKDGFFGFAFVGENGETLTKDGLNLIYKWGAYGFPFSSHRLAEIQKEADERAATQSIKSLLATPERDFLIKNDGSQVKVESLEGKVVALYFTAHWCAPCRRFTPQLVEVYKRLEGKLEVVFVSADRDEAAFEEYHRDMPWLAVPFSDMKHRRLLDRWFEVEGIPNLVFLDEQGKTSSTEGVDLVYKYGADAFPFTAARVAELKAAEERKRADQSIETLLINSNRDFLLAPEGKTVQVSELVGKTVGLYFSAHWCPPCRGFTPILASIYKELKQEGKEFEVVFISSDRDEEAYMSYYSSMPWLGLPFSDRPTKSQLSSYFEVEGIPTLVIIGPDGKTVTREGRQVIGTYKAQGFPFTEEHLRGLEEAAAALPNELKLEKHPEHPLLLESDPYDNGAFDCDICGEMGKGRVYHCEACKFDVHPHCAKAELETEKKRAEEKTRAEEKKRAEEKQAEVNKEGLVCENGVCKKA